MKAISTYVRILYIHEGLFHDPVYIIETKPDTVLSKDELLSFLSRPHEEYYYYKTVFGADIITPNAEENLRNLLDEKGEAHDFMSIWYNDNAQNGIHNL